LDSHIFNFHQAYYIYCVKTLSTLFLLLALFTLLYNNMGQVGGIFMGINEAKKEATRRIKTQKLSTITISPSDFHSGKASYINEKEILYNGNLYDIASSSSKDGIVTLSVLHDENEEGILANLKDIVDGWLNTPKNSKQHSSKQIVSIKDFIPVQKFSFNKTIALEHLFFIAPTASVKSQLLPVLKSPPKLG
jgi:hypothetical protein